MRGFFLDIYLMSKILEISRSALLLLTRVRLEIIRYVSWWGHQMGQNLSGLLTSHRVTQV